MKYGFIVHIPNSNAENFTGTIGNEQFSATIYGGADPTVAINSAEVAIRAGVTEIDLCEDFQDEWREEVVRGIKNKVYVRNAKFEPGQKPMIDKVDWFKYAVLVLNETLDPKKDVFEIINEETQTRMVGVSSIEEAYEVAVALLEEGFQCFALTRHFGEEGTMKLIEKLNNYGKDYLLESCGLNIVYDK